MAECALLPAGVQASYNRQQWAATRDSGAHTAGSGQPVASVLRGSGQLAHSREVWWRLYLPFPVWLHVLFSWFSQGIRVAPAPTPEVLLHAQVRDKCRTFTDFVKEGLIEYLDVNEVSVLWS